jgi:hypothetical protein
VVARRKKKKKGGPRDDGLLQGTKGGPREQLKKKRGYTARTVVRREEEGLHGVHRQLRRNEHPKTKEGCKKKKRAAFGRVW